MRLGIADPRFDANGYRALMMLKLSEEYYKQPTLLFDTFDGQFTTPITEADEGQQSVIHVPEILETTPGAHLVLRGYSVQLLPLLETGDIDYSVEYLSVIKQHGLKYVKLPPEINLGDETLERRVRTGEGGPRLPALRLGQAQLRGPGDQIQPDDPLERGAARGRSGVRRLPARPRGQDRSWKATTARDIPASLR